MFGIVGLVFIYRPLNREYQCQWSTSDALLIAIHCDGSDIENFGPPLDMDDIVKLKMYWCDKPDFAKLFIDMSARRMLSNNDEIEPECLSLRDKFSM